MGWDPVRIELAFGPNVVIRDNPKMAREGVRSRHGQIGTAAFGRPYDPWLGPEGLIIDLLTPYLSLGFEHLVAGLGAPHDLETVERLAALRSSGS